MNLEELNKNQKDAVTYNDGPLLILAGAGSGKTKVLTTKIAYLIKELNISPYNILAITFTNKAALEMKERVNYLVGEISLNMQISTFHSFGLRLIRENYEEINLEKNFSILDADDSTTLVRRIIKDLNLDSKQFNAKSIKNQISGLKNDMIRPIGYEKFAASEYEKQIVNIYRKYEETLVKNNVLDFDDLLLKPLEILKNKEILNKYQERFKYVLIDEYQDTNEPQYKLTNLIANKNRNLCVVGDIDQSIFSWRGANYKNILNFEKDYKDSKTIILDINYRSTKNILDAANDVIKNNVQRKEKDLKSIKHDGALIKYFKAFNEIDEAHYVSRKIKELSYKNIDYKDMAILYRTNAQSRILEEVLLKESIPYKIIGGINFYARKEIKDLLAYMKLIYNTRDEVSLERVINTPKRGIGLKTIENMRVKAEESNLPLFDVLDGKTKEFKDMILDLIKVSSSLTLTELVDKILDVSTMKEEYEKENTLESSIRLENLEEFKSITKSFEERLGIVSLEDFLEEVSLVTDIDMDDNPNRVNLMTIHSVKGLEFDNVFIVGFEEGLFPHINSLMDANELEEERRLAYVAITRARENLFFINARSRTYFGREQNNITSRFINEIKEELIDKEFKEEVSSKKVIKDNYDTMSNVEYEIGNFVYHDVFGSGKVVGLDGSIMSVAFKLPYGIKKVIKNHKSIRKV